MSGNGNNSPPSPSTSSLNPVIFSRQADRDEKQRKSDGKNNNLERVYSRGHGDLELSPSNDGPTDGSLTIDTSSVITQSAPPSPASVQSRNEEPVERGRMKKMSFWEGICLRFCGKTPKKSAYDDDEQAEMLSRRTPRSPKPKKWPRPMILPKIGEISLKNKGKKCLALDLDETLVHSSFSFVAEADYHIPVEIDGKVHNIFVLKRPGVDEFLRRMAEHYEIMIYTASLSKYADPLLDRLDEGRVISHRLFRENCVFYDGHFVKDLSVVNRRITDSIIVDNSPPSYTFHPENAIDCTSYFDDPSDVELWQIADFLESISDCSDVRKHCTTWRSWVKRNPSSVPGSPNPSGNAHSNPTTPRNKR